MEEQRVRERHLEKGHQQEVQRKMIALAFWLTDDLWEMLCRNVYNNESLASKMQTEGKTKTKT